MTQKCLWAASPGAELGEGTEAAHVPDPAAGAPMQPELFGEPTDQSQAGAPSTNPRRLQATEPCFALASSPSMSFLLEPQLPGIT